MVDRTHSADALSAGWNRSRSCTDGGAAVASSMTRQEALEERRGADVACKDTHTQDKNGTAHGVAHAGGGASAPADLCKLLHDFELQDDAAALAQCGVNKCADLAFIDEELVRELPLSLISKSKLRKMIKTAGVSAPVVLPGSVPPA